jgi:hypothetical protein
MWGSHDHGYIGDLSKYKYIYGQIGSRSTNRVLVPPASRLSYIKPAPNPKQAFYTVYYFDTTLHVVSRNSE